eukprot:6310218-Karenia_brevis.AAC.1
MVPTDIDATYLGAQLHVNCDVGKEMNARISSAINTWSRLEDLWKKSNRPSKFRLEVYVAIV